METIGSPLLWLGFTGFILLMLALDLGVFHRQAHVVHWREACIWSAVWVGLALAFGAGIHFLHGSQKSLEFLAGYLVEKSLSIDNVFVIMVIFSWFAVPAAHQHRVLFWGILGALIMRALFIALGSALLAHFHWVIYLFGALLLWTGWKMLRHKEAEANPEESAFIRLFRRLVPMTDGFRDGRFIVREGGRRLATPLLLVLVAVEATDLMFAVDSIPAIFAISRDPFIVFTSNIFAILGLRSLYFLLAGAVGRFHYLKPGLAAVLIFVGAKMLVSEYYKMPALASLAVVLALLGTAIVASLLRPVPPGQAGPEAPGAPGPRTAPAEGH